MVERINYVGRRVGNYRLVQVLGKGGFAEVYLGVHIHLNTQVAVKVLHTRLASEDVEDFRREAQIIARLVHPNRHWLYGWYHAGRGHQRRTGALSLQHRKLAHQRPRLVA